MHVPVLYKEVLGNLRPQPEGHYIDGTLGAGGHAFGILQASSPTGELLGLDLDPVALETAAKRLESFGSRAHLHQASYGEMATEARQLGWQAGVDGIVLDLGLSSLQMDAPERGFALRTDGPLDMRFSPKNPLTAADLVNGAPEGELADLIFEYGEERAARRIARAIVAARPISGTQQLAQVVAAVVGRNRSDIHPATQTFQALRIAVNGELDTVAAALPVAVGLLKPGGRLAVISFHSLEDRLVKTYFHQEARDCICPPDQLVCTCGHKASVREISRKPLAPSTDEIRENPRSRSAKLRIVEKLD